MDDRELAMLQALPLEVKIQKSKARISEWIDFYGSESVYQSFSGGLGSTVVFFLIQEVVQERGYSKISEQIPALFINTRNENPSVVHHVYSLKGQHNAKFRKIMGDRTYNCPKNLYDCIVIRKPKMFMRDVIKSDGYLIGSKKTSRCIYDVRNFKDRNDEYANTRRKSLLNTKNCFSVPKRLQYLIATDVKISHKCCAHIKHSVWHAYEKETGRYYPITGEQASESILRRKGYLKFGCNGFEREAPRSMPIGFWTQHDLLEYLLTYHLPYAKDYGAIIMKNGKYVTDGEQRTGCMACFANLTKELKVKENRFQKCEREYPNYHKYIINSLDEGGLGGGKVLDLLKIPYHAEQILEFDELLELINGNY